MLLSALRSGLMLLCIGAATAPATTGPRQLVGRVLGKPVYADELEIAGKVDPNVKFDATDSPLWEQMGRVQKAFALPILARFQREQKIEATDVELNAFAQVMRESHQREVKRLEKEVPELE